MSETDEVIHEFLIESGESLDRLDADLVALEHDQAPGPRIASIFRAVHTIKGTCGFLPFPKVEALAHVGENLLSRLRDGSMVPNPEITVALLAMADALRDYLSQIESSGSEGAADHRELILVLSRLASGDKVAAPTGPSSPVATPVPESSTEAGEIVEGTSVTVSSDRPSSPHAEPPAAEVPEEVRVAALAETAIRVQVELLDKLMNLVGELVLARNQILQFAAANEDSGLLRATQRLNLLTIELQDGIMRTRMQPISSIWNKLPRVVRELARSCGKQVKLEMVGKDTDLDRTIIEAIKDPLTHIVRNSIDHGIETPEQRRTARKPESGTLRLHAFHEGGKVNIEISDDGGGIDPIRVKAKALQRGIVSAERAARMTERELINLIFLPGFSTADSISTVSGRGVGMDVVRTNIERIGGTVDLQSAPGAGTMLRIKIPLTLAIIPALIVTTAGDRYAIPQVSLVELVRLDGTDGRRGVETIHGTPLLRLRGKLLPLVYLGELLGEGKRVKEQVEINIVVLQSDERRFGLVVDGVVDTEEIVVKPLGRELKSLSVFSGATIMGDGKVALILDVLGIAQTANVVSETRERAIKAGSLSTLTTAEERETWLLFRPSHDRRMAIPLGMVARLEEIAVNTIEQAGRNEVVQYRGDILPLVDLSKALGGGGDVEARDLTDAPLQVIVYADANRRVGLVVREILDIVEEVVAPRSGRRDASVAVVQGRVTELLDVGALLDSLDAGTRGAAAYGGTVH